MDRGGQRWRWRSDDRLLAHSLTGVKRGWKVGHRSFRQFGLKGSEALQAAVVDKGRISQETDRLWSLSNADVRVLRAREGGGGWAGISSRAKENCCEC